MSKNKAGFNLKNKNNRYRLTEEEIAIIRNHRISKNNSDRFKEECDRNGIPYENVKTAYLKSKTSTLFITNPEHISNKDWKNEIDFKAIYKEIKPVEINNSKINLSIFDRLVFTDTHIGMDVNKDSLYNLKWDKEELFKRLNLMVNYVLKNKKSDTIYIDDLGDFLDGYDNQTVRRNHELEQNMSNQEMYDYGVKFKVELIESLLKSYNKIVFHNVCNDNHAGDFAYMVNQSVKTYMDLKYPKNVSFVNLNKFISFYKKDNYTILLTHGKDKKYLKHGFAPKITDKEIAKITDFIDNNYLNEKGQNIEFCKGDSHQYIFDNSSSDKFGYFNFPAFSPSSSWVQHNYKKGKSGFVMFNYYKNNKTINEYFFK